MAICAGATETVVLPERVGVLAAPVLTVLTAVLDHGDEDADMDPDEGT